MAKKAITSKSATRPQTEDEGSDISDAETKVLNKGAASRKSANKKQQEVAPEADDDEVEEAADDSEDEELGDEEEDQDGEEEEEEEAEDDETMGEGDGQPRPRASVAQKSFKSTKKPLGKPSGSKVSIRKRLELDLAPATVRRRILQERFTPSTSQATGVFLAAALETFMRELLDLAVGTAQERKGNKPGKVKLTVQDIQKAVRSDEEFANIFKNVMFATHSVAAADPPGQVRPKAKKAAAVNH